MPSTNTELPVLAQFLCIVHTRLSHHHHHNMSQTEFQSQSQSERQEETIATTTSKQKELPKGVVLGPDGKPCRSCTSVASWFAMTKGQKRDTSSSASASASTISTSTSQSTTPPSDCPPDIEHLGRSTWTLLHTLTATYPLQATSTQQTQAKTFMSLFGSLYPCSHCAQDFRGWMAERGNEPKVGGREEFGRWMCEAHNAVNVKLGKGEFDCEKWKERWRDGWEDGRCD